MNHHTHIQIAVNKLIQDIVTDNVIMVNKFEVSIQIAEKFRELGYNITSELVTALKSDNRNRRNINEIINKHKQSPYIRIDHYMIEWVLNQYKERKDTPKPERYIELCGYKVNLTSSRYKLFKEKGTVCCKCGLQGNYFGLETHRHATRLNNQKSAHFNLYALVDGEDVLMTKDHIIPVSKGGADHIDNYQVMCVKCNTAKGNTISG